MEKSNLLDFQAEILQKGEAIFDIERQELNPDKAFVDAGIKEEFSERQYSNKSLRDFIYSHSQELAESGNFIQGKKKSSKITLSIIKIK